MLGGDRAAYREQIVVTVSRQLVVDYGRGYSEKNLRRMVQFAEAFPEEEIVVTLSRQLVVDYGRGYSEKTLRRMVQFAEAFPEEEIVVTLSRQLSWSHSARFCPSSRLSNANFTRRCAASRAGACAPYASESTPCSTNERRVRNNSMH